MSERAKKCVLVTGAGGFVGSHVVERFSDYGYQVRCFTRYTSTASYGRLMYLPKEKRDGLEFVAGDLRDTEAVNQAMKDADLVIHLGALIGIPYSYIHPREVIETNVVGTLNVLIAGKNHGIGKLVYISSSEVYGSAQHIPMDEHHILQAQSPYSASKIAAEKLVESFYDSYGLPSVILRPFNIYGPRQSARAVIPSIISQALTSPKIGLGNTTTTRDYTFVEDTVEAIIKASESESTVGKILNIGSNFEISIADLVEMIVRLVGKGGKSIMQDETRIRPDKSEVRRLWADNTLAQEVLGWRPTVSLEEGLRRTITWIEMHLDQYRPEKYEI
jgi:NAD dependent epimerase/dehydratase